MKIAMPGNDHVHRVDLEVVLRRVESILPQDGSGGWTPTPRNDSAASHRMLVGMVSVA